MTIELELRGDDALRDRSRTTVSSSFILSAMLLCLGVYLSTLPSDRVQIYLISLSLASGLGALAFGAFISRFKLRERFPVVVHDDGILFHATLVDRMTGREALVPRGEIERVVVESFHMPPDPAAIVPDAGGVRPRLLLVLDRDGKWYSTGRRRPEEIEAMADIVSGWGVRMEGW